MLLSIVVTGLLVTAQTRVLRRTGSLAVSGDRAHYLADLASNTIAIVGVGAAPDRPAGDRRLRGLAGRRLADLGRLECVCAGRPPLMDQELPDESRARWSSSCSPTRDPGRAPAPHPRLGP
jgi:hypothetical protein